MFSGSSILRTACRGVLSGDNAGRIGCGGVCSGLTCLSLYLAIWLLFSQIGDTRRIVRWVGCVVSHVMELTEEDYTANS